MTTRRRFLQGMTVGTSGALLSPLFSQLQAEAAGSQQKPVRFVFVVEGNGLPPNQICPEGIEFVGRNKREKFSDTAIKDHKLSAALAPIEGYKDRVTLIQGLSGKIAGGGHSNNFGALGAYNAGGGVGNSGTAPAETIDAALGRAHPGIFPIVNLGISDKPDHSVIYNSSASGKGKKLPTQCRPDLAYSTLFGSVAEGEGAKDFQAKGDLLDFMANDIRQFEKRIGSADRDKLNAYLQAFESLRNRQDRLVEVRDHLSKHAPVPDDKFASAVETDRLDAHFDLAAAALISGLTNVVTLASGVGDPYFSVKFTGLGIDFGKHGIGHGGSFGGMNAEEMMIKIRHFHFAQIAKLMGKLEKVPEAGGTMLDNTLIVYLSDAAEGHHSRCWEWPFVVIGDLGGKLKTGGRYLQYPDYGLAGHRTINSLYNTLLHAARTPCDDFGSPDPQLTDLDQSGPLAELFA